MFSASWAPGKTAIVSEIAVSSFFSGRSRLSQGKSLDGMLWDEMSPCFHTYFTTTVVQYPPSVSHAPHEEILKYFTALVRPQPAGDVSSFLRPEWELHEAHAGQIFRSIQAVTMGVQDATEHLYKNKVILAPMVRAVSPDNMPRTPNPSYNS